MNPGLYLFCLTPAEPLPRIEGTGIDGLQPVRLETFGDVAAVVSDVAAEEFSGPEAQERMADLTWIGPRALRHEEVVVAVMQTSPVLPVRFGTIFSSREALASQLREHGGVIFRFLMETAGMGEWMLKGFVDHERLRASTLALRLEEESGRLAGLTPGKRYVLEQKLKGEVNKDAATWLRAAEEGVTRAIQEAPWGHCNARLVGTDVTGEDREMFLHVALLVPVQARATLAKMADGWNERYGACGLSFELSGPWPPYHFAPALAVGE